MGEPRLIILDEPSLGLSPRLVEELFTLIGRIARMALP
jgi:branched-chain amino acid transport system ATP-binding protein